MPRRPAAVSRKTIGTLAKNLPRPKKSLGQHFLNNHDILNAVANAASIGPDDTVVEIGAGRGSFTRVLSERAKRVLAIELDGDLAAFLRNEMPSNVEVFCEDARYLDINSMLKAGDPYKLAGNLPYYAALPILRKFLESERKPVKAGILLQLEVAHRICAQPGKMSLMAFGVQMFANPRITRTVPPGAFNPPPKVKSAIVGLDIYPTPLGEIDAPQFFNLLRLGFSSPRRQLQNILSKGSGLEPRQVEDILTSAGIDPRKRPQTLSINDWLSLYKLWPFQGRR